MSEVYIIGIGMTKFAKHLDRNIKSLTREVLDAGGIIGFEEAAMAIHILERI